MTSPLLTGTTSPLASPTFLETPLTSRRFLQISQMPLALPPVVYYQTALQRIPRTPHTRFLSTRKLPTKISLTGALGLFNSNHPPDQEMACILIQTIKYSALYSHLASLPVQNLTNPLTVARAHTTRLTSAKAASIPAMPNLYAQMRILSPTMTTLPHSSFPRVADGK